MKTKNIYIKYSDRGRRLLLKNATKDELASAIRAVASGKKFYSPKVSEIIVNSYLNKAKQRDAAANGDEEGLPLTRREKEILYHIALGKNNTQIAEIMFISPRTVERIGRILCKNWTFMMLPIWYGSR